MDQTKKNNNKKKGAAVVSTQTNQMAINRLVKKKVIRPKEDKTIRLACVKQGDPYTRQYESKCKIVNDRHHSTRLIIIIIVGEHDDHQMTN
ncbi:hypothetical protein BLOT_002942 [Blomia tropicalis]|nr:hypothetical protein BLOT_002942 [Blomia tropicalis]